MYPRQILATHSEQKNQKIQCFCVSKTHKYFVLEQSSVVCVSTVALATVASTNGLLDLCPTYYSVITAEHIHVDADDF